MPEVGYLAVLVALALAAYAALAATTGAARDIGELVASARRAMIAVAVATTLAVGVLEHAFVVGDFGVAYVWQTSSTTTPLLYRLAGLWGGQAGSLLFWSWLMAVLAATALARAWRADAALMAPFTAICATVTGFFLFLVAFVSNPFARLTVLPVEGNGLNPLLQHPGMALHPPALYLGFTGLVIPYAFAMAALVARPTDTAWILASRRWMLAAWALLSLGLALGARWAYDVLGWGGYWGWDPVENAAFMPWIAGTAFLHSSIVQERRGLFRVWNMALVILTFCLVLVGTFLTRAGLVSSVHAFAQSEIGPHFLVFTAAVIGGSLALLWWRLPDLRSDGGADALLSRETAFLANNLVFMGALFGVFWGTLFPLVSELVTGRRVTVGAPYFNVVVLPVFWVAILLMAVAPVIGWRRADPRRVARALLGPATATLAIALVLFALGTRHWIALVGVTGAVFALAVTFVEVARDVRGRIARGDSGWRAANALFARSRRRYGGYVVHVGIALLAIGVVGSNVYQHEAEASLAPGESMVVGDYALTFRGLGVEDDADRTGVVARLDVSRGTRRVGTVAPRRDVLRLREDQPMTIPGVLHLPLEDVYTLLATFDADAGTATIKAYVNPLVSWVWLGLATLLAGTVVAAWPDAAEERTLNADLDGPGSTSGEAPR